MGVSRRVGRRAEGQRPSIAARADFGWPEKSTMIYLMKQNKFTKKEYWKRALGSFLLGVGIAFSAEGGPLPPLSEEFGLDNPVFVRAINDQRHPRAVAGGGLFLSVWTDLRSFYSSDSSDLYGALLDKDGTPLSWGSILISNAQASQATPSVAFNGTLFFVVWADVRNEDGTNPMMDNQDIYGARITTNGEVLDPEGIQISSDANLEDSPFVASDGTDFFVAWGDRRQLSESSIDVFGARISATGEVLDPDGFTISTAVDNQYLNGLAFGGDHYLAVWSDRRNGTAEADIYGARISRDGTVMEPEGLPIDTAERAQLEPAVAAGDDAYLVCWSGPLQESGSHIQCRAMGFDGAVVEGEPRVLDPANGDQRWPGMSFDGDHFVIVWRGPGVTEPSRGDVYGVRVTQELTVVETGAVLVRDSFWEEESPEIACGDGSCLTLWKETPYPINPSEDDILGVRTGNDMSLLDATPIPLSTSASNQDEIAVAFNGAHYLVVWRDDRDAYDTGHQLFGARVAPSGEVLDTDAVLVSEGAVNPHNPRVSSDGVDFLAVWDDDRSEETDAASDIYATRVRADGTVVDGAIPIAEGVGEQLLPDVAYDGSHYLVVWQDAGSVSPEIRGALLSADGTIATASFDISNSPDTERMPRVAFGSDAFLVVWSSTYLFATRVSPEGDVLDEPFRVSETNSQQAYLAVASDGTNFLVAWTDYREGEPRYQDIWTNVVSSGGAIDPAAETVLTPYDRDQNVPAVTFDGECYWVAWQEARIGGSVDRDILGARVARDGTVLDTSPFPLSTNFNVQEEFPALVSSGDGQTLVVYSRFTEAPGLNADRARARLIAPSEVEENTETEIATETATETETPQDTEEDTETEPPIDTETASEIESRPSDSETETASRGDTETKTETDTGAVITDTETDAENQGGDRSSCGCTSIGRRPDGFMSLLSLLEWD